LKLIYLLIKKVSLKIWRIYLFFIILLNKNNNKTLRVFYGYFKIGAIGGPSVKVQKLRILFPEYSNNFNLVYLLSNNIYFSKSALSLLKKRRIPILLNQNGVYYKSWFKGNYLEKNKFMAYGYHLADYVFWQSEFCRRTSDKFLGKRKGDGEILYNCVDTNLFIPKFRNKKLFTFLITGNINKENNYRIISVLNAFKKLRNNQNIRLLIAGKIQDKTYLELKSSEMQIDNKVKFIGKYNQLEAPKIYQLADAYITMTYKDNCPTAVLEAMSCGLPILYSSSGGIPELVDINSGVGLEVKSSWKEIKIPKVSEIADGMIQIMNNKKSMSESSRNRASEKFNLIDWKKKHEIIFDFLLRK